jgi:FkbM family methyltransferase
MSADNELHKDPLSVPAYASQRALGSIWLFAKISLYRYWCAGDLEAFLRLKGKLMLIAVKLGLYEKSFYTNLTCFIRPGDVVLDIGSHLGTYLPRMLELSGPTGKVIAYEPHPLLARLLRERFTGNSNITVHETAVSDTTSLALLRLPICRSSYPELALSTLEENNGYGEEMVVKQTSFAAELSNLTKVSFIKIDAEGHEQIILHAAKRELARLRPLIQVEVSKKLIDELRRQQPFDLPNYLVLDQRRQRVCANKGKIPHIVYLSPEEHRASSQQIHDTARRPD